MTINYISSLPSESWNAKKTRNLAILGSTGSIGVSTLELVKHNNASAQNDKEKAFEIVALAGGKNAELLLKQALFFRPKYIAMQDEASLQKVAQGLPKDYRPCLSHSPQAFADMASLSEIDLVVSAQVGAAGLAATLASARAGKVIALANKESLVLAGELIRNICKESGAVILPIDSEHHALFEILHGREPESVTSLLITASGGPFRQKNAEELAKVTAAEALKHPKWNMGAKITIDSATLMNKGLEVIEAMALFGIDLDRIEVVIHPESIIHSMVAFSDASVLAQMSQPDMKIPISRCLAWPKQLPCQVSPLDFFSLKSLTFEKPNVLLFPCLSLAFHAAIKGKNLPIVLNAANEVAVAAFLQGQIGFMDIPKIVEKSLDLAEREGLTQANNFEDILSIDTQTRLQTGLWSE